MARLSRVVGGVGDVAGEDSLDALLWRAARSSRPGGHDRGGDGIAFGVGGGPGGDVVELSQSLLESSDRIVGEGLLVDLGEAAFLATLGGRCEEPECVEHLAYGFGLRGGPVGEWRVGWR